MFSQGSEYSAGIHQIEKKVILYTQAYHFLSSTCTDGNYVIFSVDVIFSTNISDWALSIYTHKLNDSIIRSSYQVTVVTMYWWTIGCRPALHPFIVLRFEKIMWGHTVSIQKKMCMGSKSFKWGGRGTSDLPFKHVRAKLLKIGELP